MSGTLSGARAARASGSERHVDDSGDLGDGERVARDLLEGLVARHRRHGQKLHVGVAVREQQRDGIVVAGVAVEDDLRRHCRSVSRQASARETSRRRRAARVSRQPQRRPEPPLTSKVRSRPHMPNGGSRRAAPGVTAAREVVRVARNQSVDGSEGVSGFRRRPAPRSTQAATRGEAGRGGVEARRGCVSPADGVARSAGIPRPRGRAAARRAAALRRSRPAASRAAG